MLPQKLSSPELFVQPPAAYIDGRHFCQEKDYHRRKTNPQTCLSWQLLPNPRRQIAEKVTRSNESSCKTHFVLLTFQVPFGEEEPLQSSGVTWLLCTHCPSALVAGWGCWEGPHTETGLGYLLTLAQQLTGRDSMVCALNGHCVFAAAPLTHLWCNIPRRSMKGLWANRS